jgi:hypothetical protein
LRRRARSARQVGLGRAGEFSQERIDDLNPETNVTGDDEQLTGKIAWAQIKELPDYYSRLDRMEHDAHAEYERRKRAKL